MTAADPESESTSPRPATTSSPSSRDRAQAPGDDAHGPDQPGRPAPSANLLAGEGLHVSVQGADGPQRVLDGFSVSLAPGELVVVTGRTGSGKSTLLRLLVGVSRPDEGRVTWEGRDLAALSDKEVAAARRGFLGYVDQATPVVDGLSALDHLLLGAGPLRRSQRRRLRPQAAQVAERLRLSQVLGRDVRLLSGGERQRVALGTLILGLPRALVLDEPTSALDARTTAAVIDELRRLGGEGVGVLAATHDSLLIEAADRVLPVDRVLPEDEAR